MKRHKLAESVPAKSVSRKDTDCREIQSMSETGKVHCVRRISSSVCTCLLRCSSCMACVHSFDCTCLDYAIRGVVCTHIHAVSMAESIIDSKESELPNSISVEEIREDLANLVPICKETKKFTEIEDVRRNALSVMRNLQTLSNVPLVAIPFTQQFDTYARQYRWQGDSLLSALIINI